MHSSLALNIHFNDRRISNMNVLSYLDTGMADKGAKSKAGSSKKSLSKESKDAVEEGSTDVAFLYKTMCKFVYSVYWW